MNRFLILTALAATVIAAPVLAGPPLAKRPLCQVPKAPARDVKRPEPCRKPGIPPVIDPTPLFLASTTASPAAISDLS